MATIPADVEVTTHEPDTARTRSTGDVSTQASVDSAEIDRFDELAATWWQPDGPMWPLHRLNALRAPYIARQTATRLNRTPEDLSGLRILDIGCAAGLLSESLARLGARVTGIDASARNIDIARAHAAGEGLDIDYRHASLETLEAAPFDVVLNMEVVEHVADLPGFMARACALTREGGGLMFLATINRNLRSFVVAILGAEYVLGWLPRGTHQWRKLVRPDEAAAYLRAGGLTPLDWQGVHVNPLTRRFRQNADLGVNYMLTARRS